MLEITSELIKILECPISRGKLIYDKERGELVSLDSGYAFPVKDGVPLVLAEYGRKMKLEELEKFKQVVTADI